jgi:hypothetical protein
MYAQRLMKINATGHLVKTNPNKPNAKRGTYASVVFAHIAGPRFIHHGNTAFIPGTRTTVKSLAENHRTTTMARSGLMSLS